MIGGAHLLARRGEGQRRLEAMVLSWDGGGNRARKAAAHEGVGRHDGLGWLG
jgi:hypothetical protein